MAEHPIHSAAEEQALDEAITWFVNSFLDRSVDVSAALLQLPSGSQLLAVHLLRIVVDVLLDSSEVDRLTLVSHVVALCRQLLEEPAQ